MIQQELATEKRIVLDTPGFVAFCPFASRFPFETWILPKAHSSHFENYRETASEELARVMQASDRQDRGRPRPARLQLHHSYGPL